MKNEIKAVLANFEDLLNHKQLPNDPLAFFDLLFDESDTIQIKMHNRVHPADAAYCQVGMNGFTNEEWSKKHSESGIQFCSNAVPMKFLAKLEYFQKIESLEESRWNCLIPELREELSLRATMFDAGRTFFIEADCLPTGDYIQTNADKVSVLKELLSTGLPISYILDTGGRGPHIGIVLEEILTKIEFDLLVKSVKMRLPSWIDLGVGRVNQMERLPNTTRVNKLGEIARVTLIYLGQRVPKKELKLWLETNPVINPNVVEAPLLREHALVATEVAGDPEDAAWAFIRDHNLRSAKYITNGKVPVSCPKAETHRSGKDSTISAVIFVETGHVWCSSCNKTVGWTFKNRPSSYEHQKTLIPSIFEPVDLSSITPVRIF